MIDGPTDLRVKRSIRHALGFGKLSGTQSQSAMASEMNSVIGSHPLHNPPFYLQWPQQRIFDGSMVQQFSQGVENYIYILASCS